MMYQYKELWYVTSFNDKERGYAEHNLIQRFRYAYKKGFIINSLEAIDLTGRNGLSDRAYEMTANVYMENGSYVGT